MQSFLATKPLPSLLAKLAIPSMVALFASFLYSIVDSIFLGRAVGSIALSGLGFASPIQMFLVAFAQLFGAGAASVISRALGRGDTKTAGSTFTVSALSLATIVCSLAVLMMLLLDPLLDVLGAAGDSKIQARSYLMVLLPFTPFFCASTFFTALLRSEGRASRALTLLLVGNFLNIAFDALFILGLKQGIEGAAWATVIGHAGATALGLFFFLSNRSQIQGKRPDLSLLKEIIPLGLPSLIRQLGTGSVIALVNNLLMTYGGSDAVAAYTIINQITMLCYLPLSALVMGFAPIAGFSFGSRNTTRLKALVRLAVASEVVFGLLIMLSLQIFARLLLSLFTTDQMVATYALLPLRLVLSTTVFVGIHSLGSSYFQSIGKSLSSLMLWVSRQFLLLIPMVLLFSTLFGVWGIWWAFPLSDALSGSLSFLKQNQHIRALDA